MDLVVTHRTPGSEAYLLEKGGEVTLLYNRSLREVSEIEIPARFVGRTSWLNFDGDPDPIIDEVQGVLEQRGYTG
jgi:hypothetical protein